MSDTNPFAGLGSFFFANDPKSASAQDMRRKIALAMMMKKTPFPKTFGEGLSAIGDALGDRSIANDAIRQAQAQSEQTDKQIQDINRALTPGVISGTAVPGPRAEAEPEDTAAPLAQKVAAVAPAAVVPAAVVPAAVAPTADGADPWKARSAGIAGIESGGAKDPYSLIGARTRTGDRAIGKYQIMGANVPQWTAAALGQPMTPEQFRASPEAQEATFRHRFGQYVDKYGEEGAARAWYAGEGGMKNPNATDVHGRLTVAGYGGDYLKRLAAAGGNPNAASPQVAAAIAAPTSADAPITPGDLAQEARVADVVGMNRGPTNASFAYPQTASRTGDVISDAPQPGITGAPNGPMRDAIADTLQQRQQALQPPQPATPPPPGPQLAQANVFPQPTVSADGRVAPIIPGGGLPPPPQPVIQAAPPDPRAAIRAAPPLVEEYKPGNNPEPIPPKKSGPGPVEQRLLPILSSDVDERVKKAAELRIQQERAISAVADENAQKVYDLKKAAWLKKEEQDRKFLQDRQTTQVGLGKTLADTDKTITETDKAKLELGGYPAQLVQEKLKREAEVGKAQAEAEMQREDARIKSRTGQLPSELYPKLDKDKASIDQTIKAQGAQQLARKAIKDGVITGYGANGALVSAKFADWAFKNGMSGNLAANTEIMSATLKAGLSEAVKTVNGEGGTGVSNTDVRIAEGIQGSDPNLQLKTITTIMDRAAEINHRKIDSYEAKIDRYLSGEKAEDFYKIGGSSVPEAKVKMLLENQSDPAQAAEHRRLFNQTYGPGAAELEIKRFERAQRRSGKD